MKFLADENFSYDAVYLLKSSGYDVKWVREEWPGISDKEVLEKAQSEERIILTFDKDFGELTFYYNLNASFGVILFRFETKGSKADAEFILSIVKMRNDWQGHFTVADEEKVRMREVG